MTRVRGNVMRAPPEVDVSQSLAFWRQRLRASQGRLDVPIASGPCGRPSGRYRRATLPIPWERLPPRLLASPRPVLLAALVHVLLYRYTRRENILVACALPQAAPGRLNYVLVNGDWTPSVPFSTLHARVHQQYIEGLQRQQVTLDTLLRELGGCGQPEPALLQFVVAPGAQRELDAVTAGKLPEICFAGGEGQLAVDYDDGLHAAAAVAAMLGHCGELMLGISDNPDREIGILPLLTESERNRALGSWSGQAPAENYDVDHCVHELFEAQVARQPDAVAVVDRERSLTYAEFNRRANQFAAFLLASGIRAGDFVGLCATPGLEMLAAVMGIYKSGGVYVPLDPEFPLARLEYIVRDSRPSLVLVEAGLVGRLPIDTGNVVSLDRDPAQIASHSDRNPRVDVSLEQIAYINYTSGSTGTPKGVMGYHGGLANYLLGWGRHTGVRASDRFLVRASFSYGAFHRQFLLPLVWGASTALATPEERQAPVQLMEAVKRHGVTMLDFMPTAWRSAASALSRLPAGQRARLLSNDVRMVVAHGETLTADVVSAWRELEGSAGTPILNVCGGTEVSCLTLSHAVPVGEILSPVPVGRPVCRARVYLLDEQLQPVPVGVPGEICYGGPNVTRGYLNQPELTAARFIDDPFADESGARMFRSGDIARHLPDGTLQHLRRNDLQVKVRGYRVELEEIESVLNGCAGVERAIVDVHEHGPGDSRLTAYILPTGERANDGQLTAAVRAFAKEMLPAYMRPATIRLLDRLPVTESGKLNRATLPDAAVPERTDTGCAVIPHDSIEEQLADIWQDVLGIPRIDVDDDFFDLGGNSILAVAMLAEFEERTGHDLPLSTLLLTSTPSSLADAIRSKSWLAPDSTLVTLREGGPETPIFLMPHGGMHALCYRALAERLDPGRSVYGLEPKGVDGRLKADLGVDQQASTYIEAIRRRQPRGPYLLAGMSGGGLIAWEVAQRLKEAGEEIRLLAMFDTYAYSYRPLKPPLQRFVEVVAWWLREKWRRRYRPGKTLAGSLSRLAGSLRTRGPRRTLALAGQRLAAAFGIDTYRSGKTGRTEENLESENLAFRQSYNARTFEQRLCEAAQVNRLTAGAARWLDRIAMRLLRRSNKFFARVYAGGYYVEGLASLPAWKRKLVDEHVHVWRQYRPAPFAGKAILFRASEQPPGTDDDPFLGWRGLASHGMDVITIPGTHTSIVQSPALAAALQRCLTGGDTSARGAGHEAPVTAGNSPPAARAALPVGTAAPFRVTGAMQAAAGKTGTALPGMKRESAMGRAAGK